MDEKHDLSRMELPKSGVLLVFIMYGACIILGLWFGIANLLSATESEVVPLKKIIFLLISFSVIGSSISGSRKLYKACINNSYSFSSQNFSIASIGTVAFFIFRLLFSAAFALILFALWHSSIEISIKGPADYDSGIEFIVVSIGFFSGFSAGKLLPRFEAWGISKLDSLARNDS